MSRITSSETRTAVTIFRTKSNTRRQQIGFSIAKRERKKEREREREKERGRALQAHSRL